MIRWVRRIAFCIGAAAFFALFAVGAAAAGRYTWDALIPVCARAFLGAGVIWVAAIVIADIVVKGIAAEMPAHAADSTESGMVRRFMQARTEGSVPSGATDARALPRGEGADDERLRL
jgi:hypothetical protein